MQYNFIQNPATNENVSIFSDNGRRLLKSYLTQYLKTQTGGSAYTSAHGYVGSMDFKCHTRNKNDYLQYKIFIMFHNPSGISGIEYIKNHFKKLLGTFSNRQALKVAWHWGIELRGEDDSVCTIGLKRARNNRVQLTSPDVYFNKNAFQKQRLSSSEGIEKDIAHFEQWTGEKPNKQELKDMMDAREKMEYYELSGYEVKYATDDYQELNEDQRKIVQLILDASVKKNRRITQHVLNLPSAFSFAPRALEQDGGDIFNCNNFGKHFQSNPQLLLEKMTLAEKPVKSPAPKGFFARMKDKMSKAMIKSKEFLTFNYFQALSDAVQSFNSMADPKNKINMDA